jgi:hypothetical protein
VTQGYRTYGYDPVLRLKKAQIGGVTPATTHEYNYDAYGNPTAYGLNGQWASIGVSPATNRLTNASYDASGNQTAQLATAATYDGFNMATSYRFDASNVETFVYTANDERIGVLRGDGLNVEPARRRRPGPSPIPQLVDEPGRIVCLDRRLRLPGRPAPGLGAHHRAGRTPPLPPRPPRLATPGHSRQRLADLRA